MTVIELFQKLLRFKSVTPDDDGGFDFIEEYLGEEWTCINVDREDTKNRVYYKKFNDNPQHLCFAGHIDVVPPGEGWDVDPFAADIIDGVITARGTQDMKSGVAAYLYACKHAKNFDGTLSILMTSDEEGEGTYGTIKALEHLKEIDFIPQYAVVAEPTCEQVFGDAIKVGRRGSINGYLKIQGRQGHAAYPEKGINPIHQIAPILNDIAAHDLDNGDEYFAPSKMVLTDLRSGMQVTNVTPNTLDLMFNVRNSTNTKREDVEAYVEKIFGHLDYSLRTTQGSFPFVTNKESKVVLAMENSIKDVLGVTTKHSTAGGTSDARYFGAFGIEAIEFGVINDTIHSIGERTTVKEVEGLTEVYVDLIEKF
ncbi:succinyl-diaminopimelate desuccinylase [Poseidonibacter ostreae]|jgi:succinyl-diaminopimelate desuccinylase|uniref:Succinyl-diaminopimelate desuccinylase n=1 Tax=Poseidonibacter ostreae TaxID=2654171 RepID=A0A6L4WTG8_9BACT|nr:succinyl-diaminopimelate desuccinylase [Poseidonibacter ostreae]KAB7887151.1 succinyl-diaminopimelate desuccinylase [Poseidonibacter ostreae]KAB7889222.1 succinyl-diaminopimelate desuccinylase [Poseidonibacter ostreae]KAB7891633.1 succinyl-diaminopimelate desuccinylase [Poseidonibacter ostreae]MAC84087.1 succinyl-diaminopimelate desuccinylase [Arcobacter sp.]